MGDQTDYAVQRGTSHPHPRLAIQASLLALVSLLVWWPAGSYWQSDDFIALHYTADWGRTLEDFAGGQYGLESLVMFYRPLITLSFAIEQALGSWAQPFASHLTNLLAHTISAITLVAIARRFMTPSQSFAAGLLWAVAPSHASSVLWAVGRVDSHTTLWIALSTLFLVQWCEGRRPSRGPAILCFVLALLSKELAWVMPGVALVFGFVMSQGEPRWRNALRASWPFLLVMALYLGLRAVLLGGIMTGYSDELKVSPALAGLGARAAQLLNPLLHSGLGFSEEFLLALPSWTTWLGFLPVVLALCAVFTGRRAAFLATATVLFVGCSVPILQLWSDTGNPLNLRLFYLPMMPLAGLLALGGWRSAGPALLVFALPLAELRLDYQRAWRQCEALHSGVLASATGEWNFVSDLPAVNPRGTALQFHLGVDRLTRRPFGGTNAPLYALRPINQRAGAWRLPYGESAAMPFGVTLDVQGLRVRPNTAPPSTKDLPLRLTGPDVLTTAALDLIVKNYQAKLRGEPSTGEDPVLTLRGVRAKSYRVTIFTANGYLTTFIPDSASGDASDGQLEIGPILMGKLSQAADAHAVGDLLQRATALDLSCRFPILVEADLRPGEPGNFQATHANRTPVWVTIDRQFANWWPN